MFLSVRRYDSTTQRLGQFQQFLIMDFTLLFRARFICPDSFERCSSNASEMVRRTHQSTMQTQGNNYRK